MVLGFWVFLRRDIVTVSSTFAVFTLGQEHSTLSCPLVDILLNVAVLA